MEKNPHKPYKPGWPIFTPWYKGTCDFCHEEKEVCGIGEDLLYCEWCWYEELELCDNCGELYDPYAVDFVHIDGKDYCMYCAEELGIAEGK